MVAPHPYMSRVRSVRACVCRVPESAGALGKDGSRLELGGGKAQCASTVTSHDG